MRDSDPSDTLASLRRLTLVADHAQDPDAVFIALAGELLLVLDAEEVHVHHVTSGDEPELGVIYMLGGHGRQTYTLPRAQRPEGVGWVAATGRSIVAPHPSAVAALAPDLVGRGIRCAALFPIAIQGSIEAVVIVARSGSGTFEDEDVDVAATLVDQGATALALVRSRADAAIDPVTGALNRRAMLVRLTEEIRRAQRQQHPLSCLLIDLDDFKLVNDRFGHAAGDTVLREVARRLTGEVRAFDQVARFGGDEFVVILPSTGGDRAIAAASRALGVIRGTRIGQIPVGAMSASVGLAQWVPGMSPDDLLARADEALLRSKRTGKGRIEAQA